jgi:hypothetical protein
MLFNWIQDFNPQHPLFEEVLKVAFSSRSEPSKSKEMLQNMIVWRFTGLGANYR